MGVSVDQAIQTVRMARLMESDRRPFGLARPRELGEVAASIHAKLDLFDLAYPPDVRAASAGPGKGRRRTPRGG